MWKKIGKLDRRSAFSGNPVDSLHKAIRKLVPAAESVSDVGVSPATNAYLEEKLRAQYKREHSWLRGRHLKLAVKMDMLQYSPADVEEAEDFYVYVRTK